MGTQDVLVAGVENGSFGAQSPNSHDHILPILCSCSVGFLRQGRLIVSLRSLRSWPCFALISTILCIKLPSNLSPT